MIKYEKELFRGESWKSDDMEIRIISSGFQGYGLSEVITVIVKTNDNALGGEISFKSAEDFMDFVQIMKMAEKSNISILEDMKGDKDNSFSY